MNKETLRNYRWLRLNMKKLEDRVLEIETAITKQTSVISGTPRGSTESDKLSAGVVRLCEAKEKLLEKQLEATEAIIEIEEAIEKLDERGKCLMRLYYIDGCTWEEVCCIMNYSWTQIHHYHREYLSKLK